MKGERYAPAAKLRSWSEGDEALAGPSGLGLALVGGAGEVSLASDGSVRLRAAAGDALPRPVEEAVEREPWQPARCEARERKDGGVALRSASAPVEVEIAADPFALRVLDRRGVPLAELSGLAFDPAGRARIDFHARSGERFYGFGEKTGSLDKRGSTLAMRNRDPGLRGARDPLYVSIPFFLVLRPAGDVAGCVGVLCEAFSPSRFDVAASREDRVGMEVEDGGIDVTILPGGTPAEVVKRFTARVGRTPLPPLWALGHHQSRWSYGSEREVRRLAAELRARGIPSDAIHLDIDYMDGHRVFSWNPRRFPDPPGLLKELAQQGFRVVTIVDPAVKVDPQYPVFREGLERDAFCRDVRGERYTLRVWPGDAALPDFNRPEVRSWWGDRHRALVEAGVSGIWNDMNEPTGWKRDIRIGRLVLPLAGQDTGQLVQSDPADPERRVPHECVRNLYGLQHCRATREGLESAVPDRRPFVLTRSGYAGVQRYAAVWTGDNRSRWADLRGSIPMLLNLSISGVAFCGADIGGFFSSCTPELYARWIQLGALYPFARTHTMWATRRQEPWRFGVRVEGIARRALELRMRLLPYLYGLFREAEATGAPVWRPLYYEFPDEAEAATVEDQLMLGPSLLVAPVVERGAREREVWLPPGTWISWHDGARFSGRRRVRVPAPLERLPLFARGGSLVPTRTPGLRVGERSAEPCVLEVFPGGDGTAALVEDDGETTAYRDGAIARTALRLWGHAGGRLRVELSPREGSYPVPARTVRVAVHACPRPTAVYLDGSRLTEGDEIPGFRVAEGRVDVRFGDRGQGAAIEIDPAP
jgi:alpha-glucosidase